MKLKKPICPLTKKESQAVAGIHAGTTKAGKTKKTATKKTVRKKKTTTKKRK